MRHGGARKAGGVAAVALLCLSGSVTAADGAHVSCGATIVADTTLDADLQCTDQGVSVGASGVTFDLGGHTIEGAGRGIGVGKGPGVSGVTVKNGAVGRFQYALALNSGADHVVRDVRAYGSHDGILLHGVTGTLLERVDATGNNGSGIHTPSSRDITIRRSHIHDNAAGVGGVGLQGSAIVRNVIAHNTYYGIRFVSVQGNTFERNVVSGNGEFGIALEDGSMDNRVVRNRVSTTIGDGIFLAEDSGANVLRRNRSKRNTGDGIAVLGPGATLIRNSAARNGALGINVPVGAALARRNEAWRNGDPRQCLGVQCLPRASL